MVGALGPLCVPLPRTPCALDLEYGSQWRHKYVAKVIKASGHKLVDLSVGYRRCIWPTEPLKRCSHLLWAHKAASVKMTAADALWRERIQ